MHSYRHRYGLVPGDPAYQDTEDAIAAQPPIEVPTVVVDATRDGLGPPAPREEHARRFPNLVGNPQLPVGHDTPQEAPAAFADAVAQVRW